MFEMCSFRFTTCHRHAVHMPIHRFSYSCLFFLCSSFASLFILLSPSLSVFVFLRFIRASASVETSRIKGPLTLHLPHLYCAFLISNIHIRNKYVDDCLEVFSSFLAVFVYLISS